MNDNDIKLNMSGLVQLRKSKQVQSLLEDYGNAANIRLGEGYEGRVTMGKTRAQYTLHAVWWQAAEDNRRHNTILKAVGASK